MSQDFLFELLTEELPPKALLKLRDAFLALVTEGLEKATLSFDHIEAFATPRRLAILVHKLAEKQADSLVDRKGPALNAAYDNDGKPTQAALGFAKSCGISIEEVQTTQTDKGEWLFYQVAQKGQNSTALLADIIDQALRKLPVPKLMRWGEGEFQFARPVKNVLALYGNTVVPMNILGHKSNQQTVGHRFHHPESLTINSPDEYVDKLRDAFVLVRFEERLEHIATHMTAIAEKEKATIVSNNELLEEVTALVEWPNVLLGNFDEKYLAVPDEVLILSMATHQRYFAMRNKEGALLSQFILISNIQTDEPDNIIRGNQKVLHARFSDALFFFQQDKKRRLESQQASLASVLFEKQLGSLLDKTQRITEIASQLSPALSADKALVMRAAELCKCDLMTLMVGEFPELQGTMGRYYADNDGEAPEVASALEDYYKPRFSGDEISNNPVALCVAIADRIDTIVGIIGINKLPTGDKDPFALRRQALGILRMLLEKEIKLDISTLIDLSIHQFGDKLKNDHTALQALAFIEERLKQLLLQQNYPVDVVNAVLRLGLSNPVDVLNRIKALSHFTSHAAYSSLIAANKRVANLLKKEPLKHAPIDEKLLLEPAEKSLYAAVSVLAPKIEADIKSQAFDKILSALAELKTPVDTFFDDVMVNVDDEALKNNRVQLLKTLRALFLHVADFSELNA